MSRSSAKSRQKSDVQQPELPLAAGFAPGTPAPSPTTPAASDADEIQPGPLDERFAALLVRLNGAPDASLSEAARLASAWRSHGHVCIPIRFIPGGDEEQLSEKLLATKVIGRPGQWKPLILDPAGRLYLQRYWRYEQALAEGLRSRTAKAPLALDQQLLASGLDELFGVAPDDQRFAAEKALTGNFTVITGGPGTGKTRTVARILALLQAQFLALGRLPHVALAAPTGKAAARMTESIQQATLEFRGKHQNGQALASEAVTLHRLLGTTPENPVPRFDSRNPLPFDAVIVDEASMIDLALMSKLFAAVRPDARIILLGDRDQLASVEAGRVLGDICHQSTAGSHHPLAQRIAELRQSYRFTPGSGVDQFSRAINAGDAESALRLLRERPEGISSRDLPAPDALGRALREKIIDGFRPALTASDPAEALAALNRFRLLSAVRRGPYGVETLNVLAEQALSEAGLIVPQGAFFHGRPVMILRNDYTLRLYNGDVGMILRDPESGGALRAFFQGSDRALRRLMPSRLPEHETVWAMTVHKSQGSEFDRILLVLPDRSSKLLTRELLYTAVTRSRSGSEIWYRESILREGILHQTERYSGLHDALWK